MSHLPVREGLMGLLEDLHQTRINVENDQKAYEYCRQELTTCNNKLKEQVNRRVAAEKRTQEADGINASRATEYLHVQVKDRIIGEGLSDVEKELEQGWEQLREIRTETMSVSNRYLNQCLDFSLMYNCTALGSANRTKANAEELKEVRMNKHKLEYDLHELLAMQAKVEESEEENRQLEKEFRSQEEAERRREIETYKQLSEVEGTLEQLQKQQSLMDTQLQEEINRIQTKLQNAQQSISYWERRVSENQRRVSYQTNPIGVLNVTTSSATTPGLPLIRPRANTIQLENGHIVASNNKSPRITISQFVRPVLPRPTPPLQQQNTTASAKKSFQFKSKSPPPRPTPALQQQNTSASSKTFQFKKKSNAER